MRILLQHGGRLLRFLVVESSDRDGSLSVIVRREGADTCRISWTSKPGEQQPTRIEFEKATPKNKRMTVHQSGRVNFHENGRSIFVEPLTLTTQTTCVYRYRVPGIQKLDVFADPPDPEDAIFDVSDLGGGAVSFSFFVGPPNLVPRGKGIKLAYELEGYALVVSVDDQPFPVPDDCEEYFTTLSPEFGPFLEQQMPEDQAIISYHRALTGSMDQVLYPPNGEGVIRLIFAVPMRIAPAFKIELADPALHVTDQDVEREDRSEKVMLRFRVRNRTTGQIIRQPVAIRSIELDARL